LKEIQTQKNCEVVIDYYLKIVKYKFTNDPKPDDLNLNILNNIEQF